jgi:serine/threonine protein kinase
MDPTLAERMARDLAGKQIGGWRLEEPLGAGKSALVFRATRNRRVAALKVFDPDLVERFGPDVQLERLERELSLRGKKHPHLVEILDGGHQRKRNLFYVVMALVEGVPLTKLLDTFPREQIGPIAFQIASAARFLEELGLVHRDIKPDNIHVSTDFRSACLLDLGVIRPIGTTGVTDGDERPFVGTLQYSSPEYLLRSEMDTLMGWRALTFYQLGGVLHDLMMKATLFHDYLSPYARLVEAVLNIHPVINADDLRRDLVLLAKSCLTKDPDLRLRLVNWNHFQLRPQPADTLSKVQERIRTRLALAQARAKTTVHDEGRDRAIRRTLDFVKEKTQSIVRRECVGTELFPPVEIADWGQQPPSITGFSLRFGASEEHGLSLPLTLYFRIQLLDHESIIISVKCAVSTFSSSPQEDHVTPETLFEGPLDETTLSVRLQGLLYSSLDAAQSASAGERPREAWLTAQVVNRK